GSFFSELEPDAKIFPSNFPARNRIMAGMSHAVVIIEAAPKSGTLITARLAMEYNREVFAVPGSIFSSVSIGTNTLIRDGASPVLSADDIIEELHLKKNEEEDTKEGDSSEQSVLSFEDSISRDAFLEQFEDASTAQRTLSQLELEGKITVRGNNIYKK
ncbi:MAG: DNA-processing protein DprA, partial [Candidatus Paceibacterota bacterium]